MNSRAPIFNDFAEMTTSEGICTLSQSATTLPISSNQSSAFIDIDADCVNDILIQTEGKLEVWRGRLINGKIVYCLTKASNYDVDKKLGHFVLADFDRNGLLDIIFPILDSTKVLVGYNKIDLEYDWSQDYCKTHQMNDLAVINDVFDELIINLNSQVR
jgi:hypothetical protein